MSKWSDIVSDGGMDPRNIANEFPHYYKDVRHLDFIDIYRVLELWDVKDPAIQHAIKKLMVAGRRGVKDLLKDYKEAKVSIERAEVMKEEDAKKSQPYTQTVGRASRGKNEEVCPIVGVDIAAGDDKAVFAYYTEEEIAAYRKQHGATSNPPPPVNVRPPPPPPPPPKRLLREGKLSD